jgi:hypothetical protein
MKGKIIFLILVVLCSLQLDGFSQISLSGDFRTRTEYRNGFMTLMKEGQDPALFTSQRSRINLGYTGDKYRVWMSVQDIRTWGMTAPQPIGDDGQFMAVHEAYVEYFVNKKFSVQGGRMELAYDDRRIFGSLDWAQAGRKHDLALLKYTDSTCAVHAGFAYNSRGEHLVDNFYTNANGYKAMQFVWANKKFKDLSLSFLFFNHGIDHQFTQTGKLENAIRYSQTIGTRWEYKKNRFAFNGFAYSQTGRDGINRQLNAYDINSDLNFDLTRKFTLIGGFEYLSGTSQLATDGVNRSFTPFYGTNHLFNGYMDYFFVGSQHWNNVGLQDVFVKFRYKIPKGFAAVHVHNFQSAADIRDLSDITGTGAMSRNLGNTVDFTVRQQVTKELTIQGGYSQMFGTESMEALKGSNRGGVNNWAYLWVIFKPDFLAKRQ